MTKIRSLVRTRYEQRERYQVIGVLVFIVTICVALSLMKRGIALTQTERVLDCHAQSGVAHTHTADCYDEDGNLSCTLDEHVYTVKNDAGVALANTGGIGRWQSVMFGIILITINLRVIRKRRNCSFEA